MTAQELLTRSLEEAQASGEPDHFGLASYEGNFVVRFSAARAAVWPAL